MQAEDSINSRFIIIEKKGSGGTANVFLVKERNHDDIVYVAKVLKDVEEKKYEKYYENEVIYLNKLKEINDPNIIKLIESGEGPIIRRDRNGGKPLIKKYIVLENAEKRELADYIIYAREGLGELYSKFIFYKIMKGIQSIHNLGICHRDIKLENILLTDKFSPKIADFGFATMNAPNLEEYIGTRIYAAPEFFEKNPYDGKKADIFSLGKTLMILTYGIGGFKEAKSSCELYNLIIEGNENDYWNLIKSFVDYNFSKEFMELYMKMISYDPDDRPNANEILNHEWFKQIREMNSDQLKNLEDEIKKEFLSREPKIQGQITKEIEKYNVESESLTRGIGDDDEIYFENEIEPYQIPNEFDNSFGITIKREMDPTKLMNHILTIIDKKIGNNCTIEKSEDKPKFVIEYEDDENNENENMIGNELSMKAKLYKVNDEYLLKFTKVRGTKKNFFDKFTDISKIVKEYF